MHHSKSEAHGKLYALKLYALLFGNSYVPAVLYRSSLCCAVLGYAMLYCSLLCCAVHGVPEMSFGIAAFMPDSADADSPRLGKAL